MQPRSAGMGTCRRTDRQTACGPPTGVPWGHRSGSLGGSVQEGPALLTQAWGGTGGFRGRPQGEPAASSTVEGRTGHLNPQLGLGRGEAGGPKAKDGDGREGAGGRRALGRRGAGGGLGLREEVPRPLPGPVWVCRNPPGPRPSPPRHHGPREGAGSGNWWPDTGGSAPAHGAEPHCAQGRGAPPLGPVSDPERRRAEHEPGAHAVAPKLWPQAGHTFCRLSDWRWGRLGPHHGHPRALGSAAARPPPPPPRPVSVPAPSQEQRRNKSTRTARTAGPGGGPSPRSVWGAGRGGGTGQGRGRGAEEGREGSAGTAEAAAGGSGAAGDASELYLVSPPSETLKARRPGHTRTHTEEMHMSEHAPPPDELTDTGRDATPRPTPPRALQGPGACAPHGRHPEGRCPGRPGSVGPGPAAEPEARCSSAGHEGQLTATCPGAGSRRLCALLPGQTVPASSSCLQGEGAEHTRRRHRPHYPSSARAPRLTGKAQPRRPGAWAVLEPSRLPTRPRAESRTQPRPDWTSRASHMGWGGGRGPPGPHPPGAKMASQTRVQPGIAMMRPIGCLQTTGQPAAPCRLPQTSPRPAASGGFTWPWVPVLGTWAGRGLDSKS